MGAERLVTLKGKLPVTVRSFSRETWVWERSKKVICSACSGFESDTKFAPSSLGLSSSTRTLLNSGAPLILGSRVVCSPYVKPHSKIVWVDGGQLDACRGVAKRGSHQHKTGKQRELSPSNHSLRALFRDAAGFPPHIQRCRFPVTRPILGVSAELGNRDVRSRPQVTHSLLIKQ